MATRLTTAQIDRLGERLRQNDEISEVDLEALQGFRAEHETALVEVQTKIQDALPGIDHDKLRRQATKLSRIQDIAGGSVRIVQDMDRLEQDRVVTERWPRLDLDFTVLSGPPMTDAAVAEALARVTGRVRALGQTLSSPGQSRPRGPCVPRDPRPERGAGPCR